MKNIFILNFYMIVVTISLFGQDNSNVYTVDDLGLSNLRTNHHSISLNDSNLKTDSIAAQNMLWKPFNTNTIVVQASGGILLAAAGVAIGYWLLHKAETQAE